jgi:hypothetical protein
MYSGLTEDELQQQAPRALTFTVASPHEPQPQNQLDSPTHGTHEELGGSTGHQRPQAASFLSSVNLSPQQMHDLLYVDGNFVYLRPKGGLARTAYDLQVVDHTQVREDLSTLARSIGLTLRC